jgi:hypothetical protein
MRMIKKEINNTSISINSMTKRGIQKSAKPRNLASTNQIVGQSIRQKTNRKLKYKPNSKVEFNPKYKPDHKLNTKVECSPNQKRYKPSHKEYK